MIVNERVTAYVHSLDPGDGELCERIAREAAESFVPVIRRETAALLKTMVALKKPERILEVGTATGYSALLMASVMPKKSRIVTIEQDEARISLARAHFEEAGEAERITALPGDAGAVMKELDGPFDLIFMDAAKGQYLVWLPELFRLLSPGGLLISDNVLQGGTIVESRYAVERRERTIHARMREYLYELTHDGRLTTSVLSVGDGVALSVRRETNDQESGK